MTIIPALFMGQLYVLTSGHKMDNQVQCSLLRPLGSSLFSTIFQGHPLNVALLLLPFIFGLPPALSHATDNSPWVAHFCMFARRSTDYLFSMSSFPGGLYSEWAWKTETVSFPEQKLSIIEDLGFVSSRFLSYNATYYVCTCHLALFTLLYRNWKSGNCCKTSKQTKPKHCHPGYCYCAQLESSWSLSLHLLAAIQLWQDNLFLTS